jgi:Uma2 family endonuclease
MSTVPKTLLSPQEYLVRERAAEFRSEFYKGEMFAMAGATERHNLIAGNLYAALKTVLRSLGCRAFILDMKVRIPRTGLYTYPDVAVACGDIQYEDEQRDVLLNPGAIVEVLSKSTERRDRGWKFDQYCELPSLVDYVLVSQTNSLVEHFIRQPDGTWHLERLKDLESSLQLVSAKCAVPLREIYLDVQFGLDDDDVPPRIDAAGV